mgnify:CR=1 FL=1
MTALVSGRVDAASIRTLRTEIPFAFEENRGQSPPDYRFVLVHQNAGFSCTGLYGRTSGPPRRIPDSISFAGANSSCSTEIFDPLPTSSNFYRGVNQSVSFQNVRHYRTLRFRNVWPGVDIRYDANSSGYTMTVQTASTAALGQVRFKSPGLGVSAANGDVYSTIGAFALAGPVKAVRGTNEVSFIPNNATGAVSFTLTTTSLTRTLVPAFNFVVDPEGALYLAASTTTYSDFDLASEVCRIGACPDVYVAKFDGRGALQYLVYLQGHSSDSATQIESDRGGNVYIAGSTGSPDFVTTAGAYQQEMKQGGTAFLAKLHGPTGGLIYTTLFGQMDNVYTLQVDVFGRTYLGLLATPSQDLPRKGPQAESSPWCSEPLIAPYPGTCHWLASLDENGSELRYSQQSSSSQFTLSPYGTLYFLR